MLKIKRIIKYLLIAITCGIGSVMFISFTFEDYSIEFSNFNPNWQIYLFLLMTFAGIVSLFLAKGFVGLSKKSLFTGSNKKKAGLSVGAALSTALAAELFHRTIYASASMTTKFYFQLSTLFVIEILVFIFVLAFEPKTTN